MKLSKFYPHAKHWLAGIDYDLAVKYYLKNNDVDTAIAFLDSAISLYPKNLDLQVSRDKGFWNYFYAYTALGNCYMLKGEYEKTKDILRNCYNVTPNDSNVIYNIALVMHKQDIKSSEPNKCAVFINEMGVPNNKRADILVKLIDIEIKNQVESEWVKKIRKEYLYEDVE